MNMERPTSELLTNRFRRWAVGHLILDSFQDFEEPVFQSADGEEETLAHIRGAADVIARLDGADLPPKRAEVVDAYISQNRGEEGHLRQEMEMITWAHEKVPGYQ